MPLEPPNPDRAAALAQLGHTLLQAQGKGLVEFLESTPPGEWVWVVGFTEQQAINRTPSVRKDDLSLYCADEFCLGIRSFQAAFEYEYIRSGEPTLRNLNYRCRNCRRTEKAFALWIKPDADDKPNAQILKLGEHPEFGPPLTPRILKLVDEDNKDELRKGYRSERQGLGIGAFGYYRRVVENQKKRIIDQIIKVARTVHAGNDVISDLERARDENQFSKSIDEIKHGIPQTLLIDGHNPLKLLHDALSDGLHAQTDATCLELATAIRVVLSDLADRIDQALKDDKELKGALGRLLNRKA
jgi:hypothetical protein